MPKVTLDQKRLEMLRRQLQGKGEPRAKRSTSKLSESKTLSEAGLYNKVGFSQKIADKPTYSSSESSATYLKRDLLKILILSSLAMSIQVLLYFAVRNNLLNLNFIR